MIVETENKHTPLLASWKVAELAAVQFQKELGIEDHQCSTKIVPYSSGWRITVCRYSDGATKTTAVKSAIFSVINSHEVLLGAAKNTLVYLAGHESLNCSRGQDREIYDELQKAVALAEGK